MHAHDADSWAVRVWEALQDQRLEHEALFLRVLTGWVVSAVFNTACFAAEADFTASGALSPAGTKRWKDSGAASNP